MPHHRSTSDAAARAQHLHQLAQLRRVRDRMDREYAEPLDATPAQPYGVRDCAFRDPAGNHIRINEVR